MRRLIVLVTVAAMSLLGLVTLGGAAANATTPGKNGLIVFSADTGSGFQLYTIKPNGSGLRDLTPTGFQGDPAFTPDGHHLVYDCGDCPGGQGIFIIRDDGTGHRVRLLNAP